MRRTGSLLLVIAFGFSLFFHGSALSLTWERVGDAAWSDAGSIVEFEKILEEMLRSFEDHVVLRLAMNRCLEEEEIDGILERIFRKNDMVEASLLEVEATIRYTRGLNTVEFSFSWIESRWQREEVARRVHMILFSILSPGMTDVQKVGAVHDHIVSSVVYDGSMMGKGAWDAMNGRAVCQGYALLAAAFLTGAGFENRIVMGEDHAWNLVRVEGRWRHLDIAFDDPVIVGGPEPGTISREAFLKTDVEMEALGHRWEEKRYPEAR